MTQGQGETAVTTSALIVSGLYAYRKATETFKRAPGSTGAQKPSRGSLGGYVLGPLGVGELEPVGQWATGMGLTFIALSIATSVNATFGGSFAILVAAGAILGNAQAALKDLGHGLGGGGFPKPLGRSTLKPLQAGEAGEVLPKHERLGGASIDPVFGAPLPIQHRQPLVSSNHPPVR